MRGCGNCLWQKRFRNSFDLSASFWKNELKHVRDHFKRFWAVCPKCGCKQNRQIRDKMSRQKRRGSPCDGLPLSMRPAMVFAHCWCSYNPASLSLRSRWDCSSGSSRRRDTSPRCRTWPPSPARALPLQGRSSRWRCRPDGGA